jgi:molybdopterin-guanine dinucleotide biosynthesis protein A
MQIVFTCAGAQSRWGNYMNLPKHLIPINGRPLLQRNIELFSRFFEEQKYHVVIGKEALRELYSVDDRIVFYVPESIKEDEHLLKTLIPFLQAAEDAVLVLLGDVIFSEDCVKKIYDNSTSQVFNVFGRKHKSKITGGKWGELFAFYIPRSFINSLIAAVDSVEQLYQTKKINRFSGWEIISYIYSNNDPSKIQHTFNDRLFPDSFIEIDDTTEDFDWPDCYNTYLKLLENSIEFKKI